MKENVRPDSRNGKKNRKREKGMSSKAQGHEKERRRSKRTIRRNTVAKLNIHTHILTHVLEKV